MVAAARAARGAGWRRTRRDECARVTGVSGGERRRAGEGRDEEEEEEGDEVSASSSRLDVSSGRGDGGETGRTVLLAGRGEAARLAALVDRVADPVDARVAADGLVRRVDQDDLVVLVDAILVDPVRVEHAEVAAATGDALLGGGAERALELELVDTLVRRLAVRGTLGHGALAVTAADTDAVDDEALLGLRDEDGKNVSFGRPAVVVLPCSTRSSSLSAHSLVRHDSMQRRAGGGSAARRRGRAVEAEADGEVVGGGESEGGFDEVQRVPQGVEVSCSR